MISPITELNFVYPNWSVPARVHALSTTRQGGVSLPPYQSFNLAEHVGDSLQAVAQNRARLAQALPAHETWVWLDQQHTANALYFDQAWSVPPVADAMWTDQPGLVLSIMTADCLPILVTNHAGTLVAAIHAGWRGLADGIVQNTLKQLPEKPANLLAWIGPAISSARFEVGEDVRQAFVQQTSDFDCYFKPQPAQAAKYLADLPALAEKILHQQGVQEVRQSGLCSFEDASRFFSYRRDGQTGRMASLIWLEG